MTTGKIKQKLSEIRILEAQIIRNSVLAFRADDGNDGNFEIPDEPLPFLKKLADERPAIRIGAVLKHFRSKGWLAFRLSDICFADPSLKPSTVRAVVLQLLEAELVEIIWQGERRRGAETIYSLVVN